MIRMPATCAMLALCALLCGCPESVHPLSDPASAAPDPALFGAWRGSFDGDEVYLHVGPGERGMTQATMVEHDKKGGIKTERHVAFPTRLEGLAMLNVRAVGEGNSVRGYTLFKYEVASRKLTLWMLSYDAVRNDIRAGKLEGKAEDGVYGETYISASTEELAAYVLGGQARLFDKPLVFRRL
jgi:hypothetical protein